MDYLLLLALVIVLFYVIPEKKYKKTTYYKLTQKPYYLVRFDKGTRGEYLTYKQLKGFEGDGARFLFNCYLPKEHGETTEIDIIMIHETGMYVFESKNYSGWIFGDEKDKTWTQTLPAGRKSHKSKFENPIKQNENHIKWLRKQVGKYVPIHSVVVFSDRCVFRNVTVNKKNAVVLYRRDALRTVLDKACNAEVVITQDSVDSLFNKLYPFTQVSEEVKEQHIQNIRNRKGGRYSSKRVLNVRPKAGNSYIYPESNIIQFPIQELPDDMEKVPFVIPKEEQPAKEELKQEPSKAQQPKEQPPKEQPPREQVSDKQTSDDMICPYCGGKLQLRVAKHGSNIGQKFYGCSNFPTCRYTKDITW